MVFANVLGDRMKKKRNFRTKMSALFLVTVVGVTSLNLSACQFSQENLQPMSFEVELSNQDVEDALGLVEQLEGYIDSSKYFKIISTEQNLQEKTDYIYHQYLVSEVGYYADLEDEKAYEKYVFAEESYMDVKEERFRVLKRLYQSDLKAKEKVFDDWSDTQIKILEVSDERISELEKEQKELVREYLELEEPESEAWSTAVEEIYFKYVDSSQELAAFYGYDNYYDYAANDLYMREYSEEQREAFRGNVKEHILPFYVEVDALYREKKDQLNEEQKEQFSSLRKDACFESNEYLSGYIESYPEQMQTVMSNIFEREAIVYSEAESAHVVGFTNYSPYSEQPYVFLGNGCQDLLTLVHELGHYSAFYHFSDETLPYDTCEVHSQGNEWLMLQYLNGKLDQEVYETWLLWRLRYGLEVIIVSTLVDEYEESVYRREEITSPEEFEIIMEEVLDSYDGIENIDSPEELYTYAQYVTIESPVYYLSYATSELAAMSLYMVASETGYEAAQEIYIDLCLETPTDQVFFDTLLDVGLPDPFEIDTVIRIEEAFESMVL